MDIKYNINNNIYICIYINEYTYTYIRVSDIADKITIQ